MKLKWLGTCGVFFFSALTVFADVRFLPSLPGESARAAFGFAEADHHLYVIGGHYGAAHLYTDATITNETIVFDKNEKSWKNLSPRKLRMQGFEAAVFGNSIYTFGGFTVSGNPNWGKTVDVVERYNIEKDLWEELSVKLPHPRSSYGSAQIGSKIYLIGGWNVTPPTDENSPPSLDYVAPIDAFDLETQTFETVGTLPNPLRRGFAITTYEGKIILIGGSAAGSKDAFLENVDVFDPNNSGNPWSKLPSLPKPSFTAGAAVVGDTLYVLGGAYASQTNSIGRSYSDLILSLDLKNPNATWQESKQRLTEPKGSLRVFSFFENDVGVVGILGGQIQDSSGSHATSVFEVFKPVP